MAQTGLRGHPAQSSASLLNWTNQSTKLLEQGFLQLPERRPCSVVGTVKDFLRCDLPSQLGTALPSLSNPAGAPAKGWFGCEAGSRRCLKGSSLLQSKRGRGEAIGKRPSWQEEESAWPRRSRGTNTSRLLIAKGERFRQSFAHGTAVLSRA